jgi:O-antigen ligase
VFISLPLVEWPGSILRHNLPLFVKCVTFFYFTALIIDTDRRLRIFLLVFIACQVFRVLEPLYLHVTQGYWGEWTYLGEGDWARRLAGAPNDIINPNGLGFVIVTVIPYLHYLVWGSEKKLHRIIYIVLMPMLIYALILTMSRGAFLALCVVIWMIFKKSDRKFSMIVIVLISLAGIWSNLNDVQKDRYLSIFRSDMRQSASASGRFSGVLDEVSIGLGAPIFGHGMGTSAEAKFHAGQRARPSHNLYTEVFIEVGIIGFFLFFSFIRSIYLSFKRNIERFKELDTTDRMFVNRLNTTFIAIFWMYVVFSANYFGLSTYYWYLFAGLTVAFPRIYFPTAEPGNEKRGN